MALQVVRVLPWANGGAGEIYGVIALVLGVVFVFYAVQVLRHRSEESDRMLPEKKLFGFSVLYLFALFAALVADRVVLA